jgi:hypothetical protein
MNQIISNISHKIMGANMSQPYIIYVGVGTAAGTFTMIDGEKIVSPDNYHQYPQVLRDMENVLGVNVIKHIILIDPMLENPPHITQDRNNGFNFRKITDTYYEDNTHLIYVHVFRHSITHDAYTYAYPHPNTINITKDITDLVRMCTSHSINMIYHDFSGRQTLPMYDYYENMIGDHHDRIIFGLGAQGDFGCYVDLTSPITYFAMKPSLVRGERIHLKICSPRYYLNHGLTIYHAFNEYPNSNKNVLSEQFSRICRDKIADFVSRIFYNLRYIKQLQKKTDNELNELTFEEISKMFGQHLGMNILQRIEERNLEIAFIEAIEFYGPQHDMICRHHNLRMSGVELIYNIISNAKDEYSWAMQLRKYINY